MFKVDTLSQYVEITSNKTALLFALPKASLSMNGSYAIVIDQGAVVGLGCSYDGPPTPGISSLEDWAFDVDGVCSTGYYLAKPDYIRCVGMYNVVIPSRFSSTVHAAAKSCSGVTTVEPC